MAILGNTKVTDLTLLDGVIGNLNPVNTDVYDIGTSSLKWNNIYGTLKGNADSATALKDKSNNTLSYLNYGASGMTTTSWLGSWDGYTLKAITPANAVKAGIGTTAIGTASQPIYWDGSKFVAGNSHANTTYTFTNGTTGNFSVTPSGGTAQTVDIGKPATAGTADKAVGDGDGNTISSTYLKLAGGTMTGAIKRYYSTASTDPVLSITSNDKDVILFNIGHGTAAGTPTSCWYKLIYKGTGSSPNNTLQLIATKSTTESTAVEINEDGLITFNGTGIFKKTTDLSGTANNSPALIVGGLTTAAHLELDANEIQAKTNGTSTAALYLNNDGGSVYINNNLAGRFTATPISGQVVITDGTTGGIKSSGYTIAKSVPSNAVFTDTNNAVKQSASTTANWRKVLLHYKDDAASTTAVTDSTNQVYAAVGISAQPSTGTIRAAAYNVLDKVTLQFNSTTNALDFVFT